MFRIITFLTVIAFIVSAYSQEQIIIDRTPEDIRGTASSAYQQTTATPLEIPELKVEPKNIIPLVLPNNSTYFLSEEEKVVGSASLKQLILFGKYSAFEIDTRQKTISAINTATLLTPESEQAISQSPIWIEDQLRLKLTELRIHAITTEKDYANLIINASENIKDEVAFVVANMSYQSLVDYRFISDKEAIIRNAQYIYLYADSLNYVELVEHGNFADRTYRTTTRYRIYDSAKKDTVWSEIPYEIYYWYVVHPKMDQEGVYVKDNSNDATGQRTYGYAWRDYIWNNPDAVHDYRNVNKTTKKGSIQTIPRFGELIKSARFLWDRKKTYLPFNRPLLQDNSALDIIGNWCSRALPVDVTLPRAFQPNQILMKHDGMCNEDAFLVAATCRTALIPIIYLGTWSEDHVFGAVWDNDWHHFEFFRGGLSENGNSFYGITNMLDRGSYGWKNAMVEGFRPDGYTVNFSKYYANTSNLKLRVLDKDGNPVAGAMVSLFASPSMGSNTNFLKCGTVFTDQNGSVDFQAGEAKRYLARAYHPTFGYAPKDTTKAYVITNVNTVAGSTYQANLAYEISTVNELKATKVQITDNGGFGIKINLTTQNVLTHRNERDGQRSRFSLWNEENKGMITAFTCDSLNYEKFKISQPFEVYDYYKYLESADGIKIPVPNDSKSYFVMSTHYSYVHHQNVIANVDLLEGISSSVVDSKVQNFRIYPNPFNESVKIDTDSEIISAIVYDIYGRFITELHAPYIWKPEGLEPGVYNIIINDGIQIKSEKVIYIR